MSIHRGGHTSPGVHRADPQGSVLDLLMSLAFILSGPALWCFGAVILNHQPDPGVRLEQLRQPHGIESAEALLGLLAAASGLLICLGAVVAVLAVLTQQIAGACGARQMEQVLSHFSPGFLRRGAALILGAGLALTAVAADSWPRATETEGASAHLVEPAVNAAGAVPGGTATDAEDTDPDSVLFDTSEPEEHPSPDGLPGPGPTPDRAPDPTPDPAPDPARCVEPDPGEHGSGQFAPEAPNSDRLQGLPQRRDAEPEQVVVRLGDSLWDIAADHLGADATDWEIAQSWPRWYEMNRERIGADPGVILPGTILSVPST